MSVCDDRYYRDALRFAPYHALRSGRLKDLRCWGCYYNAFSHGTRRQHRPNIGEWILDWMKYGNDPWRPIC